MLTLWIVYAVFIAALGGAYLLEACPPDIPAVLWLGVWFIILVAGPVWVLLQICRI